MKSLHEILSAAFPNSDINAMIDAMEKAVQQRKDFCRALLQKAEQLKIDAKKAENENSSKNKLKRK